MKKMKKLASLVLALAMALTLAVPALAADDTTYTLTLNNAQPGHIYTAYQIFAGKLYVEVEGEGENRTETVTLSNIEWGSGVTAEGRTKLGDAAAKAETITSVSLAEAFAKEVAPYLGTAAGSVTISDSAKSGDISGLTAGYYLIKTTATTAENGVYTSYILKVVKDTAANIKADIPEVEKKVKDINDSDADKETGRAEYTGWQDSADHDIGDVIPFQLKATLGDRVSDYTTYKVVFHDTLSKGLTYNTNDTWKVYLGEGEEREDVTEYFDINVGQYSQTNGTTITFTCDNVKEFGAESNSKITVEYTAILNENAVIGSQGNPNKVYLEYSNNPNGDGIGKTPDDTVIVFTYKVVVNKTDEDKQPLAGATFKLEKILADGSKVNIGSVTGDGGTIFTFTGLDDGKYVLTETGTPPGYNTIKPVEFEVVAGHVTGLDSLSGNEVTGEVEIKFTSDKSAGSLTTDVVNQSGATLPSTGGMGTTLFYALGAVLVIGAGVAMVTKKRMG